MTTRNALRAKHFDSAGYGGGQYRRGFSPRVLDDLGQFVPAASNPTTREGTIR